MIYIKNIILIIVTFITINILSILLFLYFVPYENKKEFENIEMSNVRGYINSYNIFGQHFNVEGEINLDNYNFNDYKLVLHSNGDDIDINYIGKYQDNVLYFRTNNYSNTGIFLDGIDIGVYYLMFKDTKNNIYYALDKNNEFEDLTYYTITKNKINKMINISFSDDMGLSFNISYEKLPSDVYDIYLDAGHGGIDSGAIGILNDIEYMEKDINLNITLKVRDILEEKGYKVLVSRETDINLEKYGPDGRTALPYKYKTKYSFSIHNNSDGLPYLNDGGFEIYMGNNYETSFINLLAKRFIEAGLKPSFKQVFKISDGVYYMPFDEYSIYLANEEWTNRGYTLYDIKNDTPYMFMIREIGGFVTHAYTDGRNMEEGTNIYINSNQTAEPYLFELGFMTYPTDLEDLINNPDKYASVIANTIDEYLKNKES